MDEPRKLSDVKLGDKTIDHTSKDRRRDDLMKFLSDEFRRYQAEILPLYPLDGLLCGDYVRYDAELVVFDKAKTEFLESLWDVISQHFEDKPCGDGYAENENEKKNTTTFESRIG